MIMSSSYDKEQAELTQTIQALEDFISEATKKSLNVESFLNLVKKYTEIKELDAEIIRTFVDKIYVEQSQKNRRFKNKETNYLDTVELHWSGKYQQKYRKIGITSISTNHADNFLRN